MTGQQDFLLVLRGGVLSLTLNRPEHGNAIAAGTVPALTTAFRDAQRNAAVRCLVIGGAGKRERSSACRGAMSMS